MTMLHYRTYTVSDDHPWVVFVHGAGGSSSLWFKQVKEYKKHFNLLLLDLRGHGKSAKDMWKRGDTFQQVADDIIEVMDHLHIEKAHFIGMSLGTIVIQTMAKHHHHRIESMVLGGAITELNLRCRFLISLGNLGKFILPYMWLYRLFAWIIMPRANHRESRYAFVNQAKKVCQKEFMRWFQLTKRMNPFLRVLQRDYFNIPTLFIMGEQDHLFVEPVRHIVQRTKEASLYLVEKAGHVCNIDSPEVFNEVTIDFIHNMLQRKNPVLV